MVPARRIPPRTLYVLCGFLVWVIAVFAIAGPVVLDSFERLETETAGRDLDQVSQALDADFRQLAVSLRDYGEWDVVYDFVGTPTEDVVKQNFTIESLAGMQVDVVIVTDAAGHDVFSAVLRPNATELELPVAPDLRERIARAATPPPPRLDHLPGVRLMRVPSGLFAFASIPIVHTNGSGPSVGTLTFGRFIEPDELERIRRTSQLPVQLLPLDDADAIASLPAGVRERLATLPEPGTRWTLPRDADTIDAALVLGDPVSGPVAVLATYTPRAIVAAGRRTTWTLFALLALASGVFALTLGWLMSRIDRQQRSLLAEERRHRTIVEQLEDAVILADEQTGALVEANLALRRWLGYDEPTNATLAQLVPGAADCVAKLTAAKSGRWVTETQARAADGRVVEVEARFAHVQQGDRRLVCCILRDLTARRRIEEVQRASRQRLAHLAHHDVLTGLPNRLHLSTVLPRVLGRASERDEGVALFYVDLDHFKQSNDTRGHAFGDRVLKAVASRLRASVAEHDVVVRMGGDEFVIVSPGIEDAESALRVARRLAAVVRQPVELDGTTVRLSASVGISRWPDHGLAADDLLKHADIALYDAKANGRDRASMFTAEMTVQVAERTALEHALRHALDEDQLYVDYQPIVDLKTRRLVRFEALARWKHPEYGQVPPSRFIALAESSGLIVPLGERILEIVCRQLAEWRDRDTPLAQIAINVSPLQLDHEPLWKAVERMAQRYRVDPRLLAFELTETSLLDAPNRHLPALEKLRSLGCSLSIDDFGTGYSSLSYLKHLNVDTLKIDRAFIRDMVQDSSDAAIVRAVVMMARGLGVRTVAEGVETREQQAILQSLGCDYGQGYLFGRPLPARHCRVLLTELTQSLRLSETLVSRAASGG